MEACRQAAERLGLDIGSSDASFAGENYIAKGCYAYSSGPYEGRAYYGLGGSVSDMMLPLEDPTIYRPDGYESCSKGNCSSIRTNTFFLNRYRYQRRIT